MTLELLGMGCKRESVLVDVDKLASSPTQGVGLQGDLALGFARASGAAAAHTKLMVTSCGKLTGEPCPSVLPEELRMSTAW